MRRHTYQVKTATRFLNCESERAARYIYSCNKHAQLYKDHELIEEK